MHARHIRFVLALLIVGGCSAHNSSKPVSASDATVEQLISFSPVSGFWSNDGFAGQFDGLKFVRQPKRKNGQIACILTGKGELWSPNGSIPFTVTGESVGAKLLPILILPTKEVEGEGTVTQDNGLPVCKMLFRYNGKEYRADLDCYSSRAEARQRFDARHAEQ